MIQIIHNYHYNIVLKTLSVVHYVWQLSQTRQILIIKHLNVWMNGTTFKKKKERKKGSNIQTAMPETIPETENRQDGAKDPQGSPFNLFN